MRVLQVNSVCGRGSTGRITVALQDALHARGDEGRIAYGRGHHDRSVDAVRIATPLSVAVHAGLSRLTDRQGFYSSGATRRLVDEIDKFVPDVIHLHNLHGYYLNMPLLFDSLQHSGVPIIWTLHDCWAFTGHCAHFDFAGCPKWRMHCGRCPQKRAYPTSYGLDNSRRNHDDKRRLTTSMMNLTLVTPSDWLAGLVRQSFLQQHPVTVIKNGVDQSVFQPTMTDFRQTNRIEDKFLVLGVANQWNERKGLNDFVKISERLGPNYVIVLVGVDPKLARRLPSTIIAVARTDSSRQLASIYSAADVFFNPTYEDNYPTTNLEAICCGTPVVTYDTGGSPESVTGNRGAVVPQGDLDRAFTVITQFCGQRLRTPSLPLEFDERLMGDRYLALYDRTAR